MSRVWSWGWSGVEKVRVVRVVGGGEEEEVRKRVRVGGWNVPGEEK